MPNGAEQNERELPKGARCRTAPDAEPRELPNGATAQNAEQREMPNGAKKATGPRLRRSCAPSGIPRRLAFRALALSGITRSLAFRALRHSALSGILRCLAFRAFAALRHLAFRALSGPAPFSLPAPFPEIPDEPKDFVVDGRIIAFPISDQSVRSVPIRSLAVGAPRVASHAQ
jgi:hypothetical protein